MTKAERMELERERADQRADQQDSLWDQAAADVDQFGSASFL